MSEIEGKSWADIDDEATLLTNDVSPSETNNDNPWNVVAKKSYKPPHKRKKKYPQRKPNYNKSNDSKYIPVGMQMKRREKLYMTLHESVKKNRDGDSLYSYEVECVTEKGNKVNIRLASKFDCFIDKSQVALINRAFDNVKIPPDNPDHDDLFDRLIYIQLDASACIGPFLDIIDDIIENKDEVMESKKTGEGYLYRPFYLLSVSGYKYPLANFSAYKDELLELYLYK